MRQRSKYRGVFRANISDDDFLAAWNRSHSVSEVVGRLADIARRQGFAPPGASQVNLRAHRLRRAGVELKGFRRGRPPCGAKTAIGEERFVSVWNESSSLDAAVRRLAEIAAGAGAAAPSRSAASQWARRLRHRGLKLRRIPRPKSASPSPTRLRVLELFRQGTAPRDIAAAIGVSRQRVSQILATSPDVADCPHPAGKEMMAG
jgi:hypothetical protein